jgi:hypothetical protein
MADERCYEAVESPGIGWAVFDPHGELLLTFSDGDEARSYAEQLNNPGVTQRPRLREIR